jgi:hypothetical protein
VLSLRYLCAISVVPLRYICSALSLILLSALFLRNTASVLSLRELYRAVAEAAQRQRRDSLELG